MVGFTVDIDWAPEEVIADTLALFEKYSIKCTFFSTHHSEILTLCNKKLFEVAVHPDFSPLFKGTSSKTFSDILDDILDIHPNAKGIRTHHLIESIDLLQRYSEKRLTYDSSMFLPYYDNLKPFTLWNGLIRIPFNWEDDVHWSYGYSFDTFEFNLKEDELQVFNFHPIHIYLNTENKYRYYEAKKYYSNLVKLQELRNNDIKGTRDFLIMMFEKCREVNYETMTQYDIAIRHLSKSLI
ncbi:MAG TPA: hypothetical protein VGK25_01570 [Ignavibacteria bacterium]|jgi:hypothetical protein